MAKYNPIKNHSPRQGHLHDVFGLTCEEANVLLQKVKKLSVKKRLSTKSGIFQICGEVAETDSEFAFLIHEVTMLFYEEAERLSKRLEPVRQKLETQKLKIDGKEELLN